MATDSEAGFASSKLGTKEHWDSVYEKEVTNFEEFGDEGEVWFGEGSVEEMVDWCLDKVPPSENPACLDVGTGNGSLLFALANAGYESVLLHGIDYSEASISLSRSIAHRCPPGSPSPHQNIAFTTVDFLHSPAPRAPRSQKGWDLILDKGTYDAIALAPPDERGNKLIELYPSRVVEALRQGGVFLITSCNFTEDELKSAFAPPGGALEYHSKVKRPTFSFGGQSGSTITTLAFRKV